MLDSSILKDLLAKDMDLVQRLKPGFAAEDLDDENVISKGGMRRYRHKSEMVGEIAIAQKEYDEAKKRLHASKLELKRLRKEAKVASAKSNVAKIKIKALLGLMRKMIAEGQNVAEVAEEEEEQEVEESGVETLIDRKLRNIAKMIPQYNASLDEVTRLARNSAKARGEEDDDGNDNDLGEQDQYDDILREMMSIDSKTGGVGVDKNTSRTPQVDEEEAWDSLIEQMKKV